MGYDIKYEEIRNVRSAILNAVSQWQSELNLLQGYFSNLQNSIGMQGNTADSIINYTRDVHVPAITNLVEMLTEYQSKIAVYEEGFIGIDGSSESHIKQSVLEETIQQLQSKRDEYEPLHESITGVIDSVSDIFQGSKPSSIYIQDKFTVLDEKLKKLNEEVGTYENSHLTDCDSVRDYIQTIKSFINGKSGGNQVAVATYTTGSILDNPIYQELEVCKQGSQAYVENYQDEIEAVSQRNQMEIKEELDRMEKEQKLQGIISIVGGVIAIIGAVGAVVFTGGLAIPLVAAAMSVGAATATVYAASDIVEGVSRYQLAEAGRFGSIPFHPVRDIVFQGDQQLSDKFRVVGDALFLAGGVGSMLERAAVSPIQKGVTNLGGHANAGQYKSKTPPKIKNAQFSKGAGGAKSWDMVEGGGKINGREYSQHAMERMAPDTPTVRAELSRKAEKLAESEGLKVGTDEYYRFCKKYVDPRNIPPSVIEDAISSTKGVTGNTAGTIVHETADVKVIVNSSGKVITVIPK